MRLIDANLLIYAHDPSSPKHEAAKAWIESVYFSDDLVGVPRVVLLAFLRIITNPRIMQVPVATSDALAAAEEIAMHPKTVLVDCTKDHWKIFRAVAKSASVFGPSFTDAFLAALAIENGAVMCSSDVGFRRFQGLRYENPLAGI